MVSEVSASRALHVEADRRQSRGPGERTVLVGADCLTAATLGELGGGRVAALVGAACLLLTVAVVGLYRPRLSLSVLDDLPRTALAVGLAWMAVAWLAPAVREPGVLPPADSLRWWAAIFAGLVLSRTVTAALLRRRRRATGGQRTLILGTGRVAGRLARALRERPELGLDPVGLLGPSDPGRRQPLPVLGPVDRTAEIAAERSASHLVVAFCGAPDEDLVGSLRRCWQDGLSVLVVPRLYEMNVSSLRAELVGGIPLVRMRPPAVRRLTWRIKRLLDIVVAGTALLLLTPVYAACALAVRLGDRPGRRDLPAGAGRPGRRPFDDPQVPLAHRRRRTWSRRHRWNVTDDPGSDRSAGSSAAPRWTSCRSWSTCCAARCRWSARARSGRTSWRSSAARHRDYLHRHAGAGRADRLGADPRPARRHLDRRPGRVRQLLHRELVARAGRLDHAPDGRRRCIPRPRPAVDPEPAPIGRQPGDAP